MNNGIEDYLESLKKELSGSDPATVQDALADAEEHLRTSVNQLLRDEPELSNVDALQRAIEGYGGPSEVASAYIPIYFYTTMQMTKPYLNRDYASLGPNHIYWWILDMEAKLEATQ